MSKMGKKHFVDILKKKLFLPKKMKFPLLIFISCINLFVQAQSFSEIVPSPPFEEVIFGSVAFSDVDNDGDEDVLITGRLETNSGVARLYFNNGQGIYTEAMDTPFEDVDFSAIAFADVDGDNDQDVIITGEGSGFSNHLAKLFKNDGSGNFSEVMNTPFAGVDEGSVAFADIDNDGDQDVLISGRDNSSMLTSTLYENDGTGNFSEVTNTPFNGVFQGSVDFADVDGDNDQDVMISGASGISFSPTCKLFLNDGSGVFTESTSSSFERVSNSAIAFADIDSDNDQDVLITGGNPSFNRVSILYKNDGAGNFTEVLDTPFDVVSIGTVTFSDIDGDNDQDVLITGENGTGQSISKLYLNDGQGNFSELLDLPFEGVDNSSVDFADVDGDNDLDVLITGLGAFNSRITILYLNETIVSTEDTEDLDLSFSLFPNPSGSNQLNVVYESERAGTLFVNIYNSTGQLVIKQLKAINGNQSTFSFDISTLNPGNYFIHFIDGEKSGVRQFFVE